jgi:hypothetical protein
VSIEIFVSRLKEKIVAKKNQNHGRMDSGLPESEYREMVGRNRQLDEVRTWMQEIAKQIGAEEDEDEHTT